MAVDVLTEIEIDVRSDRVAAYAADPTNAPEWYVNIKAVEWRASPAYGTSKSWRMQSRPPS